MNMVESVERAAGKAVPLQLEPLTARIGAEVAGIDLTQELPDPVIDALSDAVVKHKVLFFRDQPMSVDQHIALGLRFGPLEVNPMAKMRVFANDDTRPELIVLESTPDRPIAAEGWHTDVTFRTEPAMGGILRCRICPDVGGDTLWADMGAAYQGLDDATSSLISELTAIHDWDIFRRNLRKHGTSEEEIAEFGRQFPPAEHPIVRTHPVSGEKILFVNTNFTIGIKGMKESESRPLLERLYRQAHIPDYQVRFRWRTDSVAFWDNRSTQHYGTNDFFPNHRRVERVTIAGDRPF